MSGKNGTNKYEYWKNCQSFVKVGKYFYVLSSQRYDLNKGFIFRYDINLLNKYNTNKKDGLLKLRRIVADLRDGDNLTTAQKKLNKAIKIGLVFNIGHIQSLSYNPKSKSLFIVYYLMFATVGMDCFS